MAEYAERRPFAGPRMAFGMGTWIGIALLVLAVIVVGWGAMTYNRLVRLDQGVDSQWAQVENAYQRRADLVPNLVRTVQGAARFERETLTAVVEARARVGQVAAGGERPSDDPQALAQYEAAQNQLTSALSRLLVVVERYPQLGATAAFRDLQAQLEGTENRIAVERMRFNERAREFNTARVSFPTNVVAGVFGGQFEEKAYFRAVRGAEQPPVVEF
jgi:LemA protein